MIDNLHDLLDLHLEHGDLPGAARLLDHQGCGLMGDSKDDDDYGDDDYGDSLVTLTMSSSRLWMVNTPPFTDATSESSRKSTLGVSINTIFNMVVIITYLCAR